jgi:hypothetical protein
MNPKKTLFVVLSVFIVLLICSCNPENLENQNPETHFENEVQVQQAVDSIYAVLRTDGLYKRTFFYSMDFMSLEQMNTTDPFYHIFLQYTFDATTIYIEDYWKECYHGIRLANHVINGEESINQIPDAIFPGERKDKYIGEAQFLRAFYYFLLVTRFGDVPLYMNYPAQTGMPRTSKSEIWAQIETDLQSATEKCLPKNLEAKGRATSGAAWALLGKAHLFQANESQSQVDFNEAKNAFLHVIGDASNYQLEEVYSDNFKEETENGQESVFEVDFDPTGVLGGTYRSFVYGCFSFYDAYPSRDLVNEFETVAVNGIKDDPRLGYCIYQTGDSWNNEMDTAVFSIDTLSFFIDNQYVKDIVYRCGWKKYQNYYKQPSEELLSGINFKVIRFADVLLMMAEVENELNNMPAAIDYLNEVRNRADVMMPNYGTPAMDAIYPVTNKEQIRKAIEHERKIELCNEQVRVNDLMRWRRMEAFYDEAKPSFPAYTRVQMVFNPDIHYLWPIPQTEIDLNPAITQADQNFGY